jgi:hypothetical protein
MQMTVALPFAIRECDFPLARFVLCWVIAVRPFSRGHRRGGDNVGGPSFHDDVTRVMKSSSQRQGA